MKCSQTDFPIKVTNVFDDDRYWKQLIIRNVLEPSNWSLTNPLDQKKSQGNPGNPGIRSGIFWIPEDSCLSGCGILDASRLDRSVCLIAAFQMLPDWTGELLIKRTTFKIHPPEI